MGRLGLAFRSFFAILFNAEVAQRMRPALAGEAAPPATPAAPPKPAAPAPKPPRNTCSEALLLLAALQREARLVDFLKEPIDAYADDQVGAAVREIHRESGKVLERVFALERILAEDEGAAIEIPAGYDAARFRLTGSVGDQPPFRGTLVHHGWAATTCNLPTFAGRDEAARVIAPAEVEVA
jgi:hypothetical protein